MSAYLVIWRHVRN